jgi:LacI family transcriptional regulator
MEWKRMPGLKHIALLVDGSRAYGRGIFRGVAEFAGKRDDWLILPQERNRSDNLPAWLRSNRVDGIIAFIPNARFGKALYKLGVPVIDVRGEGFAAGEHVFDSDPESIARLAADFFQRAGFGHFAFCGYPGVFFSDRRQAAFVRLLKQAGHEVRVYDGPGGDPDYFLRERSSMEYEPDLRRWLAGLPNPVAVFACNDVRGQQIINACREGGIDMPGTVAVMGVDNDDMLCELSRPTLTSIEPDTRRIGHEAAALLTRLMAGRRVPAALVNIPPVRVVERQSTDTVPVEDPLVLRAMRLLREQACVGLTVEEVCVKLDCSRTTLDNLFRSRLGHTVSAELIRMRLNRAIQLLRDTDQPLGQIARRCGLPSVAYLCRFIRRETGKTPGQFRQGNGK